MSDEMLAERMARLEERMKTMQAEYKTDIARLAEDAAKREARQTVIFVGVTTGAFALSVAIIGVLIGFQN